MTRAPSRKIGPGAAAGAGTGENGASGDFMPGSSRDARIFIGRQPIVDRERRLVAFELLFRTSDGDACVENPVTATAHVIVNAFTEFGVRDTLGPHRGYINVDRELLMSDLVAVLPPNRIVLELLETLQPDAAVIQRCRELRAAGFRLALDDVVALDDRVAQLLPHVDIVKLDVIDLAEAQLARLVAELSREPLVLLAEKVETRERAQQCLELGFHFFQGYHFARPEVKSAKRAQPARLALLRLTNLLLGEADADVIENELKQHPSLAYNLVRIVNSTAFGLTRTIDSLAQCIAVLGRARLVQWVQLLLYASTEGGDASSNPLMQMAATRGRWMESLARMQFPDDKKRQDLAFMIGILSLLGTLFSMPLEEIVERLNLAGEAKSALLAREGPLGALMRLMEQKEANDFVAATRTLAGMPFLTWTDFTIAELEAAAWTAGITAV